MKDMANAIKSPNINLNKGFCILSASIKSLTRVVITPTV